MPFFLTPEQKQSAFWLALWLALALLLYSLGPILSPFIASAILAYMLGGAVAIELIFALPGLGRLLVEAVGRHDYPLVEGGVLTIALVLAFLNLLIDVIYALVDPRIRYQ